MKNNGNIVLILIILFVLTGCNSGPTGESIYQTQCGNCHGKNGEGLKKLIPPIAHSDYLKKNGKYLPCIIQNGLHDSIMVNGILYFQQMPANAHLSAVDISNLVNYIHKNWYPEREFVTPFIVRQHLKQCHD